MLADILSQFYERDLDKLIGEINAFAHEENLWKTVGGTRNSCGNLALHIIGGTNYWIGNQLGGGEYVRNREQEFAAKQVSRMTVITGLQELRLRVSAIISKLTSGQLAAPFPVTFDNPGDTTEYVLVQLLAHLNYHLGQVNYLRRMLEPGVGS